MSKKISLVIPTYNKLPRLKLTLLSLDMQSIDKNDYEVILIDDGSDDETEEYIKKANFKFDITYKKINNSGRSVARNTGIQLASGKYIIFIDDDVLLPSRFINEHLNLQLQSERIVHGRIINITYLKFFKDPISGELYPQFSSSADRSSELKKMCIKLEDITSNFDQIEKNNKKINNIENAIENIFKKNLTNFFWLGFTGGNVSLPKSWIERAGLFDIQFGREWGSEDLELGYRLSKLDFSFYYSYDAANYHMAHFRNNFDNENIITSSYFVNKHKEDGNLLHLQDFISGKINSTQLVDIYSSL